MLNSYVILFLISLFNLFVSYPIIGGPGGWKTVPYTAYYGKNRIENDGPSGGRGHDKGPNRQGHYGSENFYGQRPDHGPPGPGHGHGPIINHGHPGPGHGHPGPGHGHPGPGHGHGHGPIIGHGHGYGHEHGHGHGNGHGHQGHLSKPFIPIPVPEKTAFLSKLIPIAGFGGSALKRLLSFSQDEYSSHGYNHRSGHHSLWPWHNPGPLWATKW